MNTFQKPEKRTSEFAISPKDPSKEDLVEKVESFEEYIVFLCLFFNCLSVELEGEYIFKSKRHALHICTN